MKKIISLLIFFLISGIVFSQIAYSQTKDVNGLNDALNKLCSAINSQDKTALEEFSGKAPQEILDMCTNEFMEGAQPECNPEFYSLNYVKSDTEIYVYACETGDGNMFFKMLYDKGWKITEFIHSSDLELIKSK